MHRARGTIPAFLLAGALLAACAEDEPADVASPGNEDEAISPVGAQCLAAEGDVSPVTDGNEEILPLTGMELAPGGDASVSEQEAIDAAEEWRQGESDIGEDVEPAAELHTVVSVDDADLGLEPDQPVWVVRYEGIATPDLTEDVTTDLACAFVVVDGTSGETVVTQYTRYQP